MFEEIKRAENKYTGKEMIFAYSKACNMYALIINGIKMKQTEEIKMMSITALVREYSLQGYTDDEIDNMICRDLDEHRQEVIDDYENDNLVQYGWAQQDTIDMYRRER